jgi:hypothetical protein
MLALASAAAVSLTLVTRAAWPRRICFTDSSKSFWNFSTSEGIFNSLPQLSQERRGKGVELGFRVNDQQPHSFIGGYEVDDARSTALSNSRS